MEDLTMARNNNHHLRKRGAVWYFRKRVNGRWIKKALSQSVTEARKLRDHYLKEILINGDMPRPKIVADGSPLFGELAQKWGKITEKRVKLSTFHGYQTAMNAYVLKKFGNTPINTISYLDVEEFLSELDCSGKTINNLLVPMRGVFKLAYKSGLLEQNVMTMVENRKTKKPQINPLSLAEVDRFLVSVNPFWKPFFTVAFFTGMRAGEMSALKWAHVDFERKLIRVVETRVLGEEGRPKTNSSYRDIQMLPMVYDALKEQARKTRLRSKYVFLNEHDEPVEIETLRKNSWTKGLKRAGLEYRPVIQTRHSFATAAISSGENLGWVQKMMGHSSLKMITDKYFSYIPNMTHNDGSKLLSEYDMKAKKGGPNVAQNEKREIAVLATP
jgi:integrase